MPNDDDGDDADGWHGGWWKWDINIWNIEHILTHTHERDTEAECVKN